MNDRTSVKATGTTTASVSQRIAPRMASPRFHRQRMAVALLVVVLVLVPTSALAAPDTRGGEYVVQWGDTLADIAARMGVSMRALAQANGIDNVDFIYVGQVLEVPGASTSVSTETESVPTETDWATESRGSGRAWIDVDLSEQWLTAYEGDTPVFGTAVSTGIDGRNTPTGEFAIEWMVEWDDMSGDGYYLPDVPYVMYFADYLAIHGTYWHDNFGYQMSHGCVNLPMSAARRLYNWASIGTPVVIHY
jgi:lipoprotein-anchoring transpeptidase ErfK/SrfK